jgi:hypothetical protein
MQTTTLDLDPSAPLAPGFAIPLLGAYDDEEEGEEDFDFYDEDDDDDEEDDFLDDDDELESDDDFDDEDDDV